MASKISFIKIGVSGPDFSHIMSFRRQVYISPDDVSLLNESTTVFYDGTSYRIFFTTDDMSCFICHQTGHLAGQCPTPNTSNHNNTNLSSVPTESKNNSDSSSELPESSINENTTVVDIQNQKVTMETNDNMVSTIPKRTLSSDSSSHIEQGKYKLGNSNMAPGKQPKKKKKIQEVIEENCNKEKSTTKSLEDLICPLKKKN